MFSGKLVKRAAFFPALPGKAPERRKRYGKAGLDRCRFVAPVVQSDRGRSGARAPSGCLRALYSLSRRARKASRRSRGRRPCWKARPAAAGRVVTLDKRGRKPKGQGRRIDPIR